MGSAEYLLVLAACLLITAPLELFGARVYRRPVRALRAIVPAAGVFLLWDILAIAGGVWTFNPEFLTGVVLPFAVPLEEALFFLVIPICAILTYETVSDMLLRRRERATGTSEGTR